MNRHIALVLASPLSNAFRFIGRRVRRLPLSNLARLVERSTRLFKLTPSEAQWLTWNLEPAQVSLASKEPASL